jgi:hypothetical protein
MNNPRLRKSIKRLITLFITGLVLSGLTALPIEWQLQIAHNLIVQNNINNTLTHWIELVYSAAHDTNLKYPFIAYGTDWLAFAHFMIAVAFIGPLRNPVKNVWVIEFGIIACVCIFPFALVAGALRGIPFYWRLIDCSFGLFGGLLLWHCYNKIKKLEKSQQETK